MIPGRCNCQRTIVFNKARHGRPHFEETTLCDIRDFWCFTIRYDTLATDLLSPVALAGFAKSWL